MKNLKTSALALLIATLIAAVLPTDAEAKIYEDTLRLHILAASNREEDQALKYEIRDELLKKYGEIFAKSNSHNETKELANELLPEIESSVNEWIDERGFDYSATVTLTEEWYDTRVYESFTMPAGTYTSLRVIIGGGDGKNWWCVMYPPLCTELATESAPKDDALIDYSKEELFLIKSGKYNIKFKTLEIISSTFRKK